MWGFVILGVITVTLLHWWLVSPFNYWRRKKVPAPEPNHLFGNMGPTIKWQKHPAQIYKQIYDEYTDCKYVGYYKFRKPGIVLRDMDLIKDVLVKEFSSFHDNDLHVDETIDPYFGKNPFCLKGEKWKVIRTLITSSITQAKVRSMFSLINHVGEDMVKYMKEDPLITSEEPVDVKNFAEKFTTDAVAICAFGLEAKSFEDPNAEFKKYSSLFSAPNVWTAIKHMATFIFPALSTLFQIKFLPLKLEDYFKKIVLETIQYREENKIVRNDYLDLLISLKSKPTKYGFNDTDVVAQAITFWLDGFETSSIAISFALYELAANPDVQDKLRNEIMTILEENNGEINYDIVQNIKYLEQVIEETLRIHTPIFSMTRLCTKAYEFPSPRKTNNKKVIIEPGTPIVIPTLAIHMDPNIYPDPHKFDPERFTEEKKAARPKYSYLSFGEGPRICLGFKFGLAQLKVVIIHILQHFTIKMNSKTKEPLELDPKIFLTTPKGGIWLNFIKRD